MNNMVILDSEIRNAKKIMIEDLNGCLLSGKKVYINASGVIGSLRNKRDGISNFGAQMETYVQ